MGKLNYREDKHLDLLSKMDNETLEVLVSIITKDKDGIPRESEDLTLQDKYKQYYPDHSKYWDLIAADYQYFGGSTPVNKVRGHGVEYEEILTDVCKKMKVNLPKEASVDTKEKNLLRKTIEDSVDEMDAKQREALIRGLNLKTTDFSKQATLMALQGAVNLGGFFAYQIAVIVANSIAKALVGHGLALAGNAAITRYLAGFAGPIGWIIVGLWTAIDIAGPALRVTVPATIYIAAIRQATLNKQAFELKCPNCGEPILNSNAKFCPECGVSL